ncbi:unnamed protein product [Sympodiomycopsis kandeliae]
MSINFTGGPGSRFAQIRRRASKTGSKGSAVGWRQNSNLAQRAVPASWCRSASLMTTPQTCHDDGNQEVADGQAEKNQQAAPKSNQDGGEEEEDLQRRLFFSDTNSEVTDDFHLREARSRHRDNNDNQAKGPRVIIKRPASEDETLRIQRSKETRRHVVNLLARSDWIGIRRVKEHKKELFARNNRLTSQALL